MSTVVLLFVNAPLLEHFDSLIRRKFSLKLQRTSDKISCSMEKLKGLGITLSQTFKKGANKDEIISEHKKLRNHKKGANKDEIISEHKKLGNQLIHQQNDLKKLDAILNDLKTDYIRCKHRFFFIRYRQMKRMIKSAVERTRQPIDDIEEVEEYTGLAGNLKTFAENAKKIEDQAKYYSERSSDQLLEESSSFQEQIDELEREFSAKRELLEQLSKDYQNSKRQLYHRRYKALKKMIKDTFSDSS